MVLCLKIKRDGIVVQYEALGSPLTLQKRRKNKNHLRHRPLGLVCFRAHTAQAFKLWATVFSRESWWLPCMAINAPWGVASVKSQRPEPQTLPYSWHVCDHTQKKTSLSYSQMKLTQNSHPENWASKMQEKKQHRLKEFCLRINCRTL